MRHPYRTFLSRCETSTISRKLSTRQEDHIAREKDIGDNCDKPWVIRQAGLQSGSLHTPCLRAVLALVCHRLDVA